MVRRTGIPCRYPTDCTPNLKDLTVDDQYLIKKDPVLLRPIPTSGANVAMPARCWSQSKTARSRTSPKTSAVRLPWIKASTDYSPQAVTQRLVNALGNSAVAAPLGVSKDRPGRWISGKDPPNEETWLQLAGLDSLVCQLLTAFTPDQARLWLEGDHPHLGARPIDVYRLEGPAPMIEAILAHEQGAFA